MLARIVRRLLGAWLPLTGEPHDCWTAEEFDTAQARDHGRA